MDQPLHLALEVLELRAYRDAKYRVERATTPEDIPQNAATDLVFQVQALKFKRRQQVLGDERDC